MQNITKSRHLSLLIAVATLLVVFSGIAGKPVPHNQGTVSDSLSNKVRSDGGGTYINGVECADVQAFTTGFYQLRTVQNSGVCNGEKSWWNVNPSAPLPYIPGQGYHRFLTLDFTMPINGAPLYPGNLDGYNSGSSQQYAPVRFIFNNAFSKNAKTTPVHIYVLKVLSTGATTQDTAWDVEYQTAAPIVINPNGSATLTLPPGSALADLYRIDPTQSVFIGTYDMPFSVTTN